MSIATALKGGVDLRGITPETVLGVLVAAQVYHDHGVPLVLTSVRDGKHMEGSMHYIGAAVDCRLPSRYTGETRDDVRIRNELAEALGPQFDVLLEADHIHLEFDPK
jgi:hypothetical protein